MLAGDLPAQVLDANSQAAAAGGARLDEVSTLHH
jgi:hypothetical protein